MPNNDKYIQDIMDLLQPRGLPRKTSAQNNASDITSTLRVKLIDKCTRFDDESSTGIKQVIENAATGATDDPELKNLLRDFHVINNKSGLISKGGLSDEAYWKAGATEDPAFNIIFKNCSSFKDCSITVVATSDPFITPADASTEDIEMFLNYTPNHIAQSLMPYLEVEFRMNKTVVGKDDQDLEKSLFHLSTPSILRFLLGSVSAASSPFSNSDRALLRIINPEDPIRLQDFPKSSLGGGLYKVRAEARAGMELFFSPQSLSNADDYKSKEGRLLDVKPFVPFASVTSFDITVLNAGSGDMVTKQGKLELEIYDRSRISEISEFIRGPAGYASAQIWTSFGWICPRNAWDEQNDEYAKFINDKMHFETCWQVRNSQFSFDQSGKAKLTLELVGFGSSATKKGSIKLGDPNGLDRVLYAFEQAVEAIQEVGRDITNSPLGSEARIVQLVNAGASGRMLKGGDEANVSEIIEKVVTAYNKTGRLDADQQANLINNLKLVLDPAGPGQLSLAQSRSQSISAFLKAAAEGTDPFLPPRTLGESVASSNGKASAQQNSPSPAAPDDDLYFSEELKAELDFFYDPSRKHPDVEAKEKGEKAKAAEKKDEKDAKKEPIARQEITLPGKTVVSFGKLFCNTILPAIITANGFDKLEGSEIQVIFYSLNDECGPVSGASIAEFPIDLGRFAYALDDAMKSRMKSDVTIQEFYAAIINNQFNDDRSIGYGMLSKWLFAPFDRQKTGPASAEQNSEYESRLAEWQAQNPSFQRPIIEMHMEMGAAEDFRASRIHTAFDKETSPNAVIKIHIYDKQHNPRKLMTQVANVGGNLKLGAWDIQDKRNEIRRLAKLATRALKHKYKNDAEKKMSLDTITKQLKALRSQVQADINDTALESKYKFKNPAGEDLDTFKISPTLFGPDGIRANLTRMAPSIILGTEGSLVRAVNLASKTDDLIAASNLINIMKPKAGNNMNDAVPPPTGLEGPGGLPLRTVPAQLTMTTAGCPNARCYQQFFIDMGTGTTLDNLFTSTQVNHKITPGKFESSFTFAYTDGYGKFGAPPSLQILLKQEGKALDKSLESIEIALNPPKAKEKDDKKTTPQPTPTFTPQTPPATEAQLKTNLT